MRKYSAYSITEYFIKLADEKGRELNILKLHFLVILANFYMLGTHGRPLIKEGVVAFPRFPVIQEINLIYGISKDKIASSFYSKKRKPPLYQVFNILEKDTSAIETIKKVWAFFGSKSTDKLKQFLTQSGTPWDSSCTILYPAIIPNDSIECYYSERLKILEGE